MEPFEITWEAPEFEHRPKEAAWYWASIGVAVLLIAIAAWQGNIPFIVFLLVAEVLVLVWAMREPRTFTFTMNEQGLALGAHTLYSYKDMDHFSLHTREGNAWTTLVITMHSRIRPHLRLHLPKTHHVQVREKLSALVKEIEEQESLIEIVERLLGF